MGKKKKQEKEKSEKLKKKKLQKLTEQQDNAAGIEKKGKKAEKAAEKSFRKEPEKDLNKEEKLIDVCASYSLEINGAHCADCDIRIKIEPRETFRL